MLQTKNIDISDKIDVADRLDGLARQAAAIAAAVIGLRDVNSDEARSGLADMVWNMRDALRELSDIVHPNGGAVAKKAVAS